MVCGLIEQQQGGLDVQRTSKTVTQTGRGSRMETGWGQMHTHNLRRIDSTQHTAASLHSERTSHVYVVGIDVGVVCADFLCTVTCPVPLPSLLPSLLLSPDPHAPPSTEAACCSPLHGGGEAQAVKDLGRTALSSGRTNLYTCTQMNANYKAGRGGMCVCV